MEIEKIPGEKFVENTSIKLIHMGMLTRDKKNLEYELRNKKGCEVNE